ncbi:MAG: hypothetical protein JW819_12310 [Candidatus Krumholzibacteriota bacterium]|nr:hypothetical protein [Candidatus Krumholzibacteriota bacterium]
MKATLRLSSLLILFLFAPAIIAVPPAGATSFRVGDLYLLTGGHPAPEIATGLLRIVPETGEVVSLGEMAIYPGSLAYDPYRDRLLGYLDGGAGGLLTVDADGVTAPLSETLPGPFLVAPRGDGILYAHYFSTNDFYYIDASDELHPLLDGSEELFSLGPDASPTQMQYDATTNALLVFGGTDDNLPGCPDPERSCVLRVPLSADGTRVEGAVVTVQVEISTTWEIVVGSGRGPGRGVLWVADTNSNDQEPRMQLLDPVTMACAPYAANGPYTGAAATNAGTYSNRLERAVILDTYHNQIRAFGHGEAGGGAIVVPDGVSDTGAGETARLVEIWPSPFASHAEAPALAEGVLTAMPNPFGAATQLRFRLDAPARVKLDIFDGRGRLVRSLARGPLGPGPASFAWDGRDARGRAVAPGIYFARLDRDGVRETRKLVLVR